MYRWQTLTLARVEALLTNVGSAALGSGIKTFLYRLEQSHFPEPLVSRGSQSGLSVTLSWSVDDRQLHVTVDEAGKVSCWQYNRNEAPTDDRPADVNVDVTAPDSIAQIRALKEWLLFGYTLGPAAVAGGWSPTAKATPA
jgi:hypothetical protein